MVTSIHVEGDDSGQIEADIQRQYTSTGRPSTRLTGYIKHRGLNLEKKIVESDVATLERRLSDQARQWIYEWDTLEKNKAGNTNLDKIKSLLDDGVQKEIAIDWKKVKDTASFPKKKPTFKDAEPQLADTLPQPNFLDKLFKSRHERILAEQKANYEKSLKLWKEKKKLSEDELKAWEKEKEAFEKRQEEYNNKVDTSRTNYEQSKPQAIEWYYQILLEQSDYPLAFQKKIAIEYKASEKLLIVEYFLPSTDDMPKVKESKYVKSSNEVKDIPFSERESNQLYEETLYQITLRTIYELFKADSINAIDSIVFNGWVNNLNKAIGKRQDVCILSIMVNKAEYMDVNLVDVDAKACFKRFKGIAAGSLSVLAPIPPILKINKQDKRFIEAVDVGQNIDDSTNIAAMDWQDFEQLVREIFEREYAAIGGEVKITQSSRDQGVDAIAFDEDPIRGGKVIIQAKRYTNTVHIESVRALYGIMQDEGAMKGILITTSDFGSDAYAFAKDKPIALLNGGNLLAMLHKHGYQGKINISEAKKLLNE